MAWILSKERLKEVKWFSLSKKSRQRHDLIAACESLRGNCVVSDGATEDSGHNLQLDMFRLNLSRNLLEVGAELWQFVQGDCGSLFLDVSRLHWTEP